MVRVQYEPQLYGENRYYFTCPGCGDVHVINTEKIGENQPTWSFNGDKINPTFQPSLLVRTGKYVVSTYHDPEGWSYICHSFITNGKIQFLADSTHQLSGKTVDLPLIDEDAENKRLETLRNRTAENTDAASNGDGDEV